MWNDWPFAATAGPQQNGDPWPQQMATSVSHREAVFRQFSDSDDHSANGDHWPQQMVTSVSHSVNDRLARLEQRLARESALRVDFEQRFESQRTDLTKMAARLQSMEDTTTSLNSSLAKIYIRQQEVEEHVRQLAAQSATASATTSGLRHRDRRSATQNRVDALEKDVSQNEAVLNTAVHALETTEKKLAQLETALGTADEKLTQLEDRVGSALFATQPAYSYAAGHAAPASGFPGPCPGPAAVPSSGLTRSQLVQHDAGGSTAGGAPPPTSAVSRSRSSPRPYP